MPKERLDKLLSNLGYCSRSQLRKQLERVTVDGIPALKVDQKVEWSQITWDGEPLDPDPLWILLHKPAGVTCSHRDQGRLVFEMFPERYLMRKPALSSVGRLDRDTTGILLLTTDGAALHRLTAPRAQIDKVYLVTLNSPATEEQIQRLSIGGAILEDDDKPLLPCHIKLIQDCQLEMTLQEGRYHQVKRMWSWVGNQVEKLHRLRFHNFTLDDLPPGKFRLLNQHEIRDL